MMDHSALPDKVVDTYNACLQTKEVLYYPSEVTKEDNKLRTEIRLCESLAKKPGPTPAQLGQKDDSDKPKPKDVFAPENWDSLLVDEFDGGLGEEYGILLNKFAVVPHHFLLVTKHWEAQTAPLTPPQLLASYQIIDAFHSGPGDVLCFYNCGPASGASQEHKHVQFAPMHGQGSLGNFPTERAARAHKLEPYELHKPFTLSQLLYAHYIRRLDIPEGTPDMEAMRTLQETYLSLLDAMLDDHRHRHADTDAADESFKLGKALSYNLLMTRKHMHIIPRKEGVFRMPHAKVPGEDTPKASTEPAIIACNALAYTGTVLVKSADDATRLKEVGGVLRALEECGFPKIERTMDVHHEPVQL